ncbi:MAG: TlpA family protein disulfide reductase [Burkholderiales bacterium]|nr:TlpA family protein disulfide reductase [Burkholderiales bacterium]OJX07576.1 MAG: hypothetical protein BGO72_09055 [Burkholderiales bacterium 70-64]
MKRHDARRRTLLALSVLPMLPVLPVLASSARHAPAFEPDTFRRIVAAGAGRPLVVHLWGLTCAPCIEELPRWSEFVRRHADANIVFVQVDPMPPERVAAVLRRAGLEHARNWSARAPVDERWRYRIDPDWAGELPRTLLIAADGRRAAISGQVGFERLRAWLGQG